MTICAITKEVTTYRSYNCGRGHRALEKILSFDVIYASYIMDLRIIKMLLARIILQSDFICQEIMLDIFI